MTDSTLDPVLRSRLIERVRVVARTHSRSFDSASADDPLGYGCLCGFKRTSLNPPGDYATHLAAVVVDALGIASKQGLHYAKSGRTGWWYPRYEGAVFTIAAAEDSPA